MFVETPRGHCVFGCCDGSGVVRPGDTLFVFVFVCGGSVSMSMVMVVAAPSKSSSRRRCRNGVLGTVNEVAVVAVGWKGVVLKKRLLGKCLFVEDNNGPRLLSVVCIGIIMELECICTLELECICTVELECVGLSVSVSASVSV